MPSPTLGEKLRLARLQRGKSLADVAKATGISRSFLSLVETSKSDITITRILKLVKYYDIHLADLLYDAGADPQTTVAKKGSLPLLQSAGEGISMYVLSASSTRAMTPMLGVYDVNCEMVEDASHEGYEFVYVLDGVLAVEIEGAETVLEAGDSICFNGRRPHRYRNMGEIEARTVEVISSPSW